MTDRLPALPDEETLVFPDSWHRYVHPRRGGAQVPPVTVNEAAGETVRALMDRTRGPIDSVLAARYGDADLAEDARRHLAGEAGPAGAATVAVVTATGRSARGVPADDELSAFVDAWVVEHGLAFAACALVEASTIAPIWGGDEQGTQGATRYGFDVQVGRESARRMRALLAAAAEREYQEAVDQLAGLREDPLQRGVVSYLVPTRQDG